MFLQIFVWFVNHYKITDSQIIHNNQYLYNVSIK